MFSMVSVQKMHYFQQNYFGFQITSEKDVVDLLFYGPVNLLRSC